MKLSERGYRKIKAYEGYGRRLPDGSCTAYQEEINGKLDIPTIGYGCTKGVKMGDVWTEEQADAQLREEIAGHEARVLRMVTVELNQNEFDALVSFDYNCGGLQSKGKPSGMLKALNAGDRLEAMRELETWNKFGGKPAKGLIARRADEKALFLEPTGPVDTAYMPQKVEEARTPMTERAAVTTATAVTTTGLGTAKVGIDMLASPSAPAPSALPSVSKSGSDAVDMMAGAKQVGGALQEFAAWAAANPKFAIPGFLLVILPLLLPYVQAYLPQKAK